MNITLDQTEIDFTFNSDGEIEFRHNGTLYRSVGTAVFDNSPNNNFSTYSAPIVCPEDEEYPDDRVGSIVWDIIYPDCEDESNACDWDKFTIFIG